MLICDVLQVQAQLNRSGHHTRIIVLVATPNSLFKNKTPKSEVHVEENRNGLPQSPA